MFRYHDHWTEFVDFCKRALAVPSRSASMKTVSARENGEQRVSFDGHRQYQAILDDQTELICRYYADGTLVYVNPAYCRYFGLTQQDLINHRYHPVVFEADRTAVERQVQSMTCEQPQVTIENRVVVKGEVRWTQWNNRCFCDDHGNIVAYQAVGRDITDVKTVEYELRKSEARYRNLIETIPQLVWVAAADGLTAVDVNHRWLEYTGQTDTAIKGRGWLAAVHPDDVESVLAHWEAVINGGAHYEAEYRLRRADGVYVWHLSRAEPIRDDQGNIVRWYGTCTDISDRKETELKYQQAELALQQLNSTLEERVAERTQELLAANQALKREISDRQAIEARLKENEMRLRQAIVDAPFPIFIHTEDGKILQTSQVVTDITGYVTNEIDTLEKWAKRAYGEQQAPEMLTKMNRLYRLNRRIHEGEIEVNTRCGEKRIWLFISAPLGNLSDGRKLVISMAADVTQQKKTEAALANRLRQQAVVTQLSQVALSGLNLQTLFDRSTQLVADSLDVEFCKVLECLPDGRSLLLRSGTGWHPGLVGNATVSSDSNSQAGYTLQVQQPVIVTDFATETRFQGPPLLTQHRVVSGMSTLISGEQGPFGILGAHSTRQRQFTQNDINFLQAVANLLAAAISRKQTEAELNQLNQTLEKRIRDRTHALEEVNQELEAFSYSVAHDLRAPLRSIQGFGRVLQEDYGKNLDPEGQEYIARMAASAEYLDSLIQDLLAYSQLGRAEITLRRINIVPILENVIEDLESEALSLADDSIQIVSEIPSVYAQRSILRQVFYNLLSNALKFVAPGAIPKVKIWAEKSPNDTNGLTSKGYFTRIWIQDNGIGIAPRHQERVFKPFERLHGIDMYPGTGIGLSIVARGIRRMGGRIGVESAENQGSRFWVELKSG